MAGAVSSGQAWADGDQVTSTKLAAQFTGSAMTSDAITGTTLAVTGGKLKVNTITATEIDTGAVTTAKIAAAAVTADKIASAVAGDGLAGGAGTALSVTVDDSGIEISSDTLQLKDDGVTYAKVDVATQAEMQAESAAGVATPDSMTNHPGIAKAYGTFDCGATPELDVDYNIASVTRTATSPYPVFRVTLDNAMSSADYTVMITAEEGTAGPNLGDLVIISAKTTTTFDVKIWSATYTAALNVMVFGTLA